MKLANKQLCDFLCSLMLVVSCQWLAVASSLLSELSTLVAAALIGAAAAS